LSDSEAKPVMMTQEQLDTVRRLMVVSQGGDPDSQQTINNFLKFDDDIERTNLPKRADVLTVAYLDYAGKTLYPDMIDDPFSQAALSLAKPFMAFKGGKSNQFVEMMKQTDTIASLETTGESPSLFNRMMGRGKGE